MKKADFKRFVGRTIAIANVLVRGEASTDGIEIRDETATLFKAGHTSTNDYPVPEYVQAALRGANWTAAALSRTGRIGGCRVAILRVGHHWPDTKPDAIECAAGIAVHQLLLPKEPELESYFEGSWRLRIWDCPHS